MSGVRLEVIWVIIDFGDRLAMSGYRLEAKIVKQSKIAHSCATTFDSVKFATEQNGGHFTFSKRAAFLVVVRPRSRRGAGKRVRKESKE